MKITDVDNIEYILGEDDYLKIIKYHDLDTIPSKLISLSIRQGSDTIDIIVKDTETNSAIVAKQIRKQESNFS